MLTKSQFPQFRDDVKDALKVVEEKYGFVFDLGNISYDSRGMTIKNIKVGRKIEGVDDEIAPYRASFFRYRRIFNLSEDAYNRPFTWGGSTLRIVGLKKSGKYVILCQKEDGTLTWYRRTIVTYAEMNATQKSSMDLIGIGPEGLTHDGELIS